MNFLAIKWDDGREVAINRDGSIALKLDDAELLDEQTAVAVAKAHGGTVVSEQRLFGDDDSYCDDIE